MREKDRVSLVEFTIAMVFATIFIAGYRLSIVPRKLILVTLSIGVAYGVETIAVLWYSGVYHRSLENKLEPYDNIIKVITLIGFTYVLLDDSNAVQEFITGAVYFIFFIWFWMIVLLYLLLDVDEEDTGRFVLLIAGLLLSSALLYTIIVVAVPAATLPTPSVLTFAVIIGVVSFIYWYRIYRIREKLPV